MNAIHLVQLTDLHIREPGRLAYGRLDTAPYLRTALDSIARLRQRPDALVLTGDLTDFGREAEYSHLQSLLSALDLPVYLLPGNHDDRAQMRRSFPEHGYLGDGEFIQYSVDLGPLQLIALDSVEAGHSAGRLCSQRLAWLARELERQRDRPVILAIHHPPFRTLIGHMDRIGLLEGTVELERLVAEHGKVQRVICGHLHRTIYRGFGGTVASTAPSPAHQVSLNLSEDAASSWILEPPGFHIHVWTSDHGLVTHAAASGQFEGPFPFRDQGGLID